MDELEFTWRTGLKLFAGLMLLAVWYLTREQAKLEKKDQQIRDEAKAAGKPEPEQRIVPRSNYMIVAAAVVLLVIALMLGNGSTI